MKIVKNNFFIFGILFLLLFCIFSGFWVTVRLLFGRALSLLWVVPKYLFSSGYKPNDSEVRENCRKKPQGRTRSGRHNRRTRPNCWWGESATYWKSHHQNIVPCGWNTRVINWTGEILQSQRDLTTVVFITSNSIFIQQGK